MFSVVIILIKSEKIPFNIEVTFETLQLSTQSAKSSAGRAAVLPR